MNGPDYFQRSFCRTFLRSSDRAPIGFRSDPRCGGLGKTLQNRKFRQVQLRSGQSQQSAIRRTANENRCGVESELDSALPHVRAHTVCLDDNSQ